MIELVVVLGLLSFVGAFALFMTMDSYRGYTFRGDRDLGVSVLQKARSQAINNMCFGASCTDGKSHGVRVESDRLIVFQGGSYATRDAAVDEVIYPQSKSTVFSGMSEVVFAKLSGEAAVSPSGNKVVTVQNSAGANISTISVTPEGRICADDLTC